MGLFSKKPAPVVQEFGYQDAVDYLRALPQADYAKILKVVETYREADKKVKKILNIKDAPVTAGFGEVPTVDEDSDIADLFLEDELEVTPPKSKNPSPSKGLKKATKIEVKE